MTPMPAADEPEYLKVEEVAARLKLKEKRSGDAGAPYHCRAGARGRSLGSRRSRIASRGSLKPLRHVCILYDSTEDLDHARHLICQDELFTAGRAAGRRREAA